MHYCSEYAREVHDVDTIVTGQCGDSKFPQIDVREGRVFPLSNFLRAYAIYTHHQMFLGCNVHIKDS
jgi:hypothetical protein